jgi:hypothetical protein
MLLRTYLRNYIATFVHRPFRTLEKNQVNILGFLKKAHAVSMGHRCVHANIHLIFFDLSLGCENERNYIVT